MRAVDRETLPFRQEMAAAHRNKARRAAMNGDASLADWHFARARGQLLRFERVAECGEHEFVIRCNDCGAEGRRFEARCSQRRLCTRCRAAYIHQYRGEIAEARSRALRSTLAMFRPGAPGGSWDERFMTLTVPHSGDVRYDVKTLRAAWPVLLKKLWKFFRAQGLDDWAVHQVRYLRVLEVTPGRRNDGHAHFHVYLICPYLPHELVRQIWGTELARRHHDVPVRPLADVLDGVDSEYRRAQLQLILTFHGAQVREVYWPDVDLVRCYGSVEDELVKYLVKDSELHRGQLRLVDPQLGARIYEALEGVRTIASSRRFFRRELRRGCCAKCGSTSISRATAPKAAEQPAGSATSETESAP